MSYIKNTWANGDIITAEKLNHIEDGIESNITGYEVSYEPVLVFEGSLTTVNSGGMNYVEFEKENALERVDSLIVTIDGVKYELPNATPNFPILDYGETTTGQNMPTPVFDNYPCYIMDYGPIGGANYAIFATEEAGTYQVKIEYYSADADVSKDFVEAVSEASKKEPLIITFSDGEDIHIDNLLPWQAVVDAYNNGQEIMLYNGWTYLKLVNIVTNDNVITSFYYIYYPVFSSDEDISGMTVYELNEKFNTINIVPHHKTF